MILQGEKQGKAYHLHAPTKSLMSGHHKRRPVIDFHKGTAPFAFPRLCKAPSVCNAHFRIVARPFFWLLQSAYRGRVCLATAEQQQAQDA